MQPSFPFSEMKTELTTRGVSFSGKAEENRNNNETACEWLNVSRGVQYTTLAEVPKHKISIILLNPVILCLITPFSKMASARVGVLLQVAGRTHAVTKIS